MPHPTEAESQARRRLQDALAFRYVDLLHIRFPHLQSTADALLGSSQTFRDLVAEYGVCADALDHLSHEQPNAPLLEHYAALRFDLERMLLQQIVDHGRSDDPQ